MANRLSLAAEIPRTDIGPEDEVGLHGAEECHDTHRVAANASFLISELGVTHGTV
jgi:hypothetical protein